MYLDPFQRPKTLPRKRGGLPPPTTPTAPKTPTQTGGTLSPSEAFAKPKPPGLTRPSTVPHDFRSIDVKGLGVVRQHQGTRRNPLLLVITYT